MDCLIQKCIIFNILISIVSVTGIIRSPCPLACDCDLEKGVVDCKYGAWSKLPNIPAGTRHIRMEGIHFEKIKKFAGPSSCQNYSEVTNLELYINFSSLTEDASRCMPKLHSLTIKQPSLIGMSNMTFMGLLKLEFLSYLHLNEDILSRLCDIRQLEKANLRLKRKIWNIKPPFPACLGSLEHLSDMRLEYISVTQTLQPLRNVSNSISLQHCDIDQLHTDTFFRFKARILDLSWNLIRYISRQTFIHMPNLVELHLEENYISDSVYKPLMELSSLQVLSLTVLDIYEVPLVPNNIRKLKFEPSQIRKLTQGSFSNLENLEELDLSMYGIALVGPDYFGRSGIDYIEKGALHNLPKLQILKLAKNVIVGSSLSNLLSDVAHSPLRILDLSGNPLHTSNKTFQALNYTKLERLYLSSCKIKEITRGEFGALKCLLELDLSHNEIKYLLSDTFQGLTNLTTVKLNHNILSSLDGDDFGFNIPLKYLNLSNNQIQTIYLHNFSTLIDIDLSHNQIRTFLTSKDLTSLRYLNLSSNQITSRSSESNDFLILPNLTNLDLSGNPVISPAFTQGFPGLESLKLSSVSIGHYMLYYWPVQSNNSKDIWANKTQLKSLYINSCQITTLTPGMFNSSSWLQVLDVSSNGISSVNHSAFQGIPMLTELYLHDNDITFVNFESFVSIPHLRLLSLANNPLVCTCEVLWIFQAVTTLHLVYIPDQDTLACNSPVSVEHRKIKELDMKVSDCESNWVKILEPIAAGFGSILVLVFLYITWYYRWNIRYTLFLARAGLGRFQEYVDDYPYKYDAFVAYSEKDLSWVKNQMLPNVDKVYIGQGGFTLCLHHRDWLGGIDIAENIVKSITESRRTILVLSKNFVRSQWCQYELAMAHLKANAEGYGKDRLVVILLNDIPSELLTPRLVYILTTKTYLPWPQDPDEQQFFWKT